MGLYGPHQLCYDTKTFLAKVSVSKTMSLHFNARDSERLLTKEEVIAGAFRRIFDGLDETVSRKVFAKKFDVSQGYLQSRFMTRVASFPTYILNGGIKKRRRATET